MSIKQDESSLALRVGNWSYQHPWRIALFAAMILLGLNLTAGLFGDDFRQSFSLPGSETSSAVERLEADGFRTADGYQGFIVVSGHDVRGQDARDATATFLERIQNQVSSVAIDNEAMRVSEDGKVGFVALELSGEVSEAQQQAAQILSLHETLDVPSGVKFEFGGEPFQTESEFSSEGIGLVIAAVILLFAFGSVVVAGLPIVTALVGIGCAVAVVQLATRFIDIPPFTPGLVAMIGIGAGIDYALFIVTRYREELQHSPSVWETVARAMSTAGRATLFAGTTVVISLLALLVVGLDDIRSVALAAASGVLFVMLASITVLPALLRAVRTRLAPLKTSNSADPREAESIGGSAWYRWSRMLQRRPVSVALLSSLVLIALTAPVISMRLGLSDAGNRPEDDTTRRAYDLITEAFGPGFNGPLIVAADMRATDSESALVELHRSIAGVQGVETVHPPLVSDSEDTALLQVIPATGPQEPETANLVERLRGQTADDLKSETGIDILVGGAPAAALDFATHNARILPWFIAVVLVLSFGLLMTVFRSVLVPLKAVIMNLLSVGAAYGALVAVFQWGWFAEGLGVGMPGPIEAWVPMMMFAVVFGLSMDYEVFLLSRIQEQYLRTGSNSTAVADGIARTARLISAAAAIMVSVFGAFVFSGERALQMMGFGLAVAIAVDATLVRLILVPATMELLGDRNWWLPQWLARVLPDIRIGARESQRELTRSAFTS